MLADTLRTLTVMTCALLNLIGGLDADRTDAIGSLVVCAVVAAVALEVAYETVAQWRRLRTPAVLAVQVQAGGVHDVLPERVIEPLDFRGWLVDSHVVVDDIAPERTERVVDPRVVVDDIAPVVEDEVPPPSSPRGSGAELPKELTF